MEIDNLVKVTYLDKDGYKTQAYVNYDTLVGENKHTGEPVTLHFSDKEDAYIRVDKNDYDYNIYTGSFDKEIMNEYSPEEREFYDKAYIERHRQVNQLGYSDAHDNEHGLEHLLSEGLAQLAKGQNIYAGALIIASIDLLHRMQHGLVRNQMQADVEDFMRRCDQEVKKYPELPSEKIRELRIQLMSEELLGSTRADSDSLGKNDRVYGLIQDKSDELVQSMLDGDLVGIADGLADVLYVVFGTAAAYGINIAEVFAEVHRSNLTKSVWDKEQQRYRVIKRADGKALKPDTFSPAKLEPIVMKQIKAGASTLTTEIGLNGL